MQSPRPSCDHAMCEIDGQLIPGAFCASTCFGKCSFDSKPWSRSSSSGEACVANEGISAQHSAAQCSLRATPNSTGSSSQSPKAPRSKPRPVRMAQCLVLATCEARRDRSSRWGGVMVEASAVGLASEIETD